MNLVIVESPAKAKTLKKFLGKTYKIEASVGHIKDLPKSDLGVDFDNDYEPRYITIRGKGDVLAKLKKEAKAAKKVYLATDPDREGEAISWHLKNALGVDDKVSRVTFNQITKDAVKNAIKDAREIDMNLVDAQQARRVLDRVVGYKISPLLWRKIKRKGLSAGRVQSVALRIICDREAEIDAFVPEEYWSVDATFLPDLVEGNPSTEKNKKEKFDAKLFSIQDGDTEHKMSDKYVKTAEHADQITKALEKAEFTVDDITSTRKSRKPSPTFTTSTMQQEASKNLGFPTNKTMMLAQQLYEGVEVKGHGNIGLLTYIRTDSTRIADEAYASVRDYLAEHYGPDYTPTEMRTYKNKGGAQDAHEGIRPTFTELTPEVVTDSLSKDQLKLYRLVWQRFVASQMPDAIYETQTIKVQADQTYNFRANATKVVFEGYTKVYKPKEKEEDEGNKLPDLAKGKALTAAAVNSHQHFTQPPARYNDATLVKTLEEKGIGRPSTYSAIITTLTARNYMIKDNKVFYVTELGEIINNIMETNFEEIVDIDFTAKMESDLDRVEEGDIEWKEILRGFYPHFASKVERAEELIGDIVVEDEVSEVICEKCGRNMVVKYGRFGKFLACPGFPDCRNAKPFFEELPVPCPECSGKVLVKKSKKGRQFFGCEHNAKSKEEENNPGVCNFISWNRPIDKACPECNHYMVEKGSKKPMWVCSHESCGHREEKPEEDDTE